MLVEEGIAEDDEDSVIDWYLDYSFYVMEQREYWREFLCGVFQIIL